MRIATNTRFLLHGHLEGFGIYTDEIMRRMTSSHADDHFDFYFDRKYDSRYIYGENVQAHVLFPPARHPILFRIWYEHVLRPRVDKSKADVFFSPDSFMPTRLCAPAVITLHDVAYARYPGHISRPHLRYYRKWMPFFVERAAKVITVSHFSRREILELFPVDPAKVVTIPNGVSPNYEAADHEQIQAIRERLTGGAPYFCYIGAIHPRKNVTRLVKAYEMFRENTKSDVQLLIAGRLSWKVDPVLDAIQSCPFKQDIRLLGYIDRKEKRELLQGALAMVNVSLYEGFGLPVLEAQASGTPVIASSPDSTGAALAEVGRGAIVHANPISIVSIAEAMSRLNQDTSLHNQLKLKGLENAKRFDWDATARATYEVLTEVIAQVRLNVVT